MAPLKKEIPATNPHFMTEYMKGALRSSERRAFCLPGALAKDASYATTARPCKKG